MSRSSAPSRSQPKRQQRQARARALTLHTLHTDRRDSVCSGLIQLAHSWRNLNIDIRDERAWASYAADVALDLAKLLVSHANSMRAASGTGSSIVPNLLPLTTDPVTMASRVGHPTTDRVDKRADDPTDEIADCIEMCDDVADAAVISLLHVVATLTPPDDELTVNSGAYECVEAEPVFRSGDTGRRGDQLNVI